MSMQTLQAARPYCVVRRGAIGAKRQTRRCTTLRVCATAAPDQYWGRQFTCLSTSQDATAYLAKVLAEDLRAGDAYCLKGDPGAGKSTFSEAFVRAATQNPDMAVSPPPQSLYPNQYSAYGQLQPGEFGDLPILHYDVGNLQRPSDAECERVAATFPSAVSLIEWAELLREWGAAPEQRLAIYFRRLPSNPEADVRLVTVVPHTGSWEVRVSLLRSNLSISGPGAGVMMLSDEMATELTAGMPECLALAK